MSFSGKSFIIDCRLFRNYINFSHPSHIMKDIFTDIYFSNNQLDMH